MPLNPKLFKGQLHLLYFLDLFIHSLRDSQVVSIQNMEEAFKQCCYERGSTDSSLKLMISSYIYIFGYIPRNEIAGPYADSAFNFLRNLCSVLHRGCLSLQGFPFFHILPTFITPCLIANGCPNSYEVKISLWFGFAFFLITSEDLFMYLLANYISLEKYLFRSFPNFLIVYFFPLYGFI